MNRRSQVGLVAVCVSLSGCLGAGRLAPAPPAPVPTAGPVATEVAVGAILESLRGLAFDEFLSASHLALVARSPEQVTELDLAAELGVRNDQLDDVSLEHASSTQALQRAVLSQLRQYDRAALAPEQQLSYDIFEWYLDDLVRGQQFAEHDYLVYHCRGGYHYELLRLLEENHPMASRQDAEDYVERLGQVDDQVAQVLAALRRREAAGVIPPRFIIWLTQEVLANYLGTTSRDPSAVDPTGLSVYTTFAEKLDGIADLSDGERAVLRDRALAETRTSFVPAYMAQLDFLDHLADVATDDAGVWKLPDGDAYYAQLVRSEATTDLTPDQVYDLGVRQVTRVRSDLRQELAAMGYPEELELAEAVRRAIEDAGVLPMETPSQREAVLRAWEALIVKAEQRLGGVFGHRPASALTVVGDIELGSEGAYYDPEPPEGTKGCEFHVDQSTPSQPRYIMPTVAFHEAVPGHHFQVGLAHELDVPRFRHDLRLTGFSEGWAQYAERLAWEQGLYDGEPSGNIGRLVTELIRAARMVADTGMHHKRWTADEARIYMDDTIGAPPGVFDREIDRIVATPARAVGNDVGMLALLDLRDRARTALGERFDLRAFHDAVIGHGNVPLKVLDRIVEDYIAATLRSGE